MHEIYLWNQWADLDQISCEPLSGRGKGLEFWLPWQHIAPIDLTWEKFCHHRSGFNFFRISFILAVNEDMHKISIKFDFGLNRIFHLRVTCPWLFENLPIVPVVVLIFVALWFILRGDLLYVFPCVILFLCFSLLLVLRLSRLGKRELILVLFVRSFDLCLFGFVGFLFLLGSGRGCGL